jgi:hypothetical protein
MALAAFQADRGVVVNGPATHRQELVKSVNKFVAAHSWSPPTIEQRHEEVNGASPLAGTPSLRFPSSVDADHRLSMELTRHSVLFQNPRQALNTIPSAAELLAQRRQSRRWSAIDGEYLFWHFCSCVIVLFLPFAILRFIAQAPSLPLLPGCEWLQMCIPFFCALHILTSTISPMSRHAMILTEICGDDRKEHVFAMLPPTKLIKNMKEICTFKQVIRLILWWWIDKVVMP